MHACSPSLSSMAAEVTLGEELPWPSNLRVMVVDDDSRYLALIEKLLAQCNYTATGCRGVEEAMSVVVDNPQSVDLIISDVFLPSHDGLFILKSLAFELDVPVIMMSWSGDVGMIMNYIAHGACDFLVKPVKIKELRNIWQHVFRKQLRSNYLYRLSNNDSNNANVGMKKQKGNAVSADHEEEERERDEVVTDVRHLKKARLHWTSQLHHQFVAAVNTQGLDKAMPKKILEMMKVQHLTREQVASHLQKYRIQLQKSSVPVESVESSMFDPDLMLPADPANPPPHSTPSSSNTAAMETHCSTASVAAAAAAAEDINICFDLIWPATPKQPFPPCGFWD